MSTVLNALTRSIRDAARFNAEVEVEPACVLWTDGDSQWLDIIHRLREELPELIVLGKYAPEARRGPAIWLRGVLAGHIDDTKLPPGQTPVVYLPGVSRQQLRDVENIPEHLAPLAELQFRGTFWTQANTRDWTVFAFFKSANGGLSLDVAQNEASKTALVGALPRLLDEELIYLRDRRLDERFLNHVIAGRDPVRDLLQWLNGAEEFRRSRTDAEWNAFVQLAKTEWDFHPDRDGYIAGALKLAAREGSWNTVWDRYSESPRRYPNIPAVLRSVEPPSKDLLWRTDDAGRYDGWPQWNDEQEATLRSKLASLAEQSPKEAREQLLELEAWHARRRNTVWADLGEAPLARAMRSLNILAEITAVGLDVGGLSDVTQRYADLGWKADDAVLTAMSCVRRPEDIAAVTAAIRSIYLPWADAAARHLQQLCAGSGYPGGTIDEAKEEHPAAGECILFVDGLRFDVAKRLVRRLSEANLEVTEQLHWAAIPSVTETGKPAVTPVRHQLVGNSEATDFMPSVREASSAANSYHLERLLTREGWQVLKESDKGAGEGASAWTEFGNIDKAGHDLGLRLAQDVDSFVKELEEKIVSLLTSGWRKVRVVTDHGWLLMPGGLPKAELPPALVESKWRRFATLKQGASTDLHAFPWYWNVDRSLVIAPGIRAFRTGMVYTHGGLSFQECLTLHLAVSAAEAEGDTSALEIVSVTWQGLRCRVIADGASAAVSMDIRLHAGDPASSVVAAVRTLREDGTGSVVVEDDRLIGEAAFVVFLSREGRLIAQRATTIGGGDP